MQIRTANLPDGMNKKVFEKTTIDYAVNTSQTLSVDERCKHCGKTDPEHYQLTLPWTGEWPISICYYETAKALINGTLAMIAQFERA